MIREIVKDTFFLSQKSLPAGTEDLPAVQDLLDTLKAHKDGCVGMAANMIGVLRCIIAADLGSEYLVMLNPVILRGKDGYETEEGCLSLEGVRKTHRWRSIRVQYQNTAMQTRIRTFTGFPAQIIQHEMDHCSGILI